MFRQGITSERNTILNKKKFLAETAGAVTKEQADKLDDQAVIKPGSVVNQGDILIGAMKKQEVTPEQKKLGMFSKRFLRPAKPQEITWDKESPGTVTRVVKHGKNTTVYVNTQASATIGDKIVGRHGNKGIITHILPDHEMPKTMGGKVAEVLLNPTGLPTRINVGQVLETAAGKIAEKTGKPYTVNNFDPDNRDYTRNLMKELKVHGLKDTEEMVDPATGKPYGPVLFGPQYILKLHHTAAKGLSARSRHAYDSNMVPQRGGPNGGQTMDAMGMYALLAHNARENVREMQTYKSNNNDQFWEMIQSGDSPPTPKVPFVFKKFEGYLKGMGVDVQKEGNDIILQPLTDKKVLEMSNGELRNPNQSLRGKDLKPEPGGIFDPKATGTRGIASDLGTKWSHIKLAERMPNPVFESPIASLLALPRKHVGEIVAGKRELEGKTGPSAISDALKKVDVNKEAASLKAALPTMRTSNLNKANKKLKYLRALQKAGASPVDAYTMKYVPVLPPTMRPVALRDNGDLVHDSLNDLYTGIGKTNYQLKTMDPAMPEEEKNPLHEALYDGIRSLSLTGTESQGKHLNGIAEIIAGRGSPKEGFFQAKVIGRRQDLSMRGTIVPEPSLSLDEVAIPRKAAAEVYKPFVVANLVNRRGYSPLMAQQKVKEDGIEARSALDEVAAERPLLLKRDPVLHKYGVQAFKPRLVTGKAIKIHPLATTGYNADFDGDKMSAYVPVSQKAVKEAWKMLPSNNLFSPSTGFVMFKPTQESMQGLFKLTEMGKKTNKTFNTAGEAARAVKEGKIGLDDVITVKNFSGLPGLDKLAAAPKRTTVGRMMVYNALPSELRTDKVLTDKEFVLNKGKLQDLLTDVAALDKGSFGSVSDKLKDLGNARSTGLSIGLSDFLSDYEERDKILGQARKVENKIRASKLTPSKRDEKIVQLYIEAGKQIDAKAKAKAEAKPNRMYDWIRSGARGSWDNYKQMTVTPLLVADTQGKPIPVPIDRSYSEGLDIGSYWASMYGARMGTISRAEGTWRPGYMSKQMMQSTMNQMIVSDDCGTKKGMALPIDERDILGRYTANDIKLKKGKATEVIPAGTVIDPDIVNRLKNNRVTEVPVRTPLRCLHGKGMCSKCYGLNENGQLHQQGVNVGIIAAHALGEPATQLSMNSFHTGGVVGAKGTTAQGTFDRVNQLLQVPKILPGSATLAKADGKVDKIDKDPAGGWSVYVSGQRHYVPTTRDLAVKKGVTVKKGEAISTGVKNPRDMLPLTGMPTVQRYITDELHNIYQGVGSVKRRNTETFVRAMTNLSKVVDPGDHEDYLPGDTVPSTEVARYNSQKASESKPVRAEPLLHGVSVLPLEVQTDWLARMQATNLRSTILDAAAERWGSAVHSTHPIPGMAYGAEFGKGTPEKPWLY
jgi:DNA-directed RNA polymerase subunit beta'